MSSLFIGIRFNHKGHKGHIERRFGIGELTAKSAKGAKKCKGAAYCALRNTGYQVIDEAFVVEFL